MPNPKILRLAISVIDNRLEIVVTRDTTDVINGASSREDTVTGPLNTLAGLGALRNNLIAWVKAQSGFAGTVDIAP